MRIILPTVLLFQISTVYSQDPSDSTGTYETSQASTVTDTLVTSLNPVIVTASRKAQRLSQSIPDITTISQKQIRQHNSRSTAEALMGNAGVWVQKTNHGGGSPFIRGLTGNQVLTLIDGIRLNNATFRYGPNQYLSSIDPVTIHQIEVVRSSGSMLYGSDALGGVLNVISGSSGFSENKTKVDGFASAKFMTEDMEQTINGNINIRLKKIAWNVQSSWSDFGDIVSGNDKKQTPTSYSQKALFTKLITKINNIQTLTLCYQYLKQNEVDLYDQVTQRGYAVSLIDPQLRHLGYIRWTARFKNTLLSELQLTVSDHFSEEGRSRQRNNSEIRTEENDKVNTIGVLLDASSQFNNNWSAKTGVDFYFDKVNSWARDINTSTSESITKRGLYPDGSTMSSLALFHLQEYQIKRLFLQGGLRANLYHTKVTDDSHGDVDMSNSALVGSFGAVYHLGNRWNIVGSISTAFRAPNINDLSTFGRFDFGVEVPSPELEPERSFNKELSIKKITDRSLVTLTAFHNKLFDLIERVKSVYNGDTIFNGDRVYTKANFGEAVIYGFEGELNLKIYKSIFLFVNLNYAFGENKTAGEPVRRIPPLFGKLSGQHEPFKNFYYAIDWLFAGEQDRLASGDKSDHRINPNGTPGWGIINLRLGYAIAFVSLHAGIENLFDQSYRVHGSGIDGYGRCAWLRTTIHF